MEHILAGLRRNWALAIMTVLLAGAIAANVYEVITGNDVWQSVAAIARPSLPSGASAGTSR